MKNKSLKHWIVLACCCGLAASAIGAVINTVGVFYTPVSEDLGVLRGTFALNATCINLAIAVASLVSPKLIDKFNFKLIILVGALLAGGATVMMGFSRTMMMFYILGAIKGFGAGLYSMVLINHIINNWFEEKIGTATSIVLSFSGVAGAILSPILTSLINSIGWEKTYFILGIITVLLVLPAVLYPFKIKPEVEGMLPYGANAPKTEGRHKYDEVSEFNPVTLKFIVFVTICVALTMITSLTSHLPGYADSLKIDATIGALMISCGMVGNILSKLIIGVLSDLFGVLKAVFVMGIINIIAMVGLLTIHVPYAMLALTVLFGSIYSICAVGITLLTKEFFGTGGFTKAYSIVQFATNTGGAISLTLFGFVYDITGSYAYDFIIGIVIVVVSLLILLWLNKQPKPKAWQ